MSKDLTEQLNFVEDMLVQGYSPTRIARAAADRFGVTEATGMGYVRRVHARWRAESEVERPLRRDRLRAMTEDLYRKCLEAADYMPATKLLDRLAKLDGVDEPERVRHEHSGAVAIAAVDLSALSYEEIVQLEALTAKALPAAAAGASEPASDESPDGEA